MKPLNVGPFVIDVAAAEQDALAVDIPECAITVYIKLTDDGIVVDLYPFPVRDTPVASTWARFDEFLPDEE